MSGPLDPLLLTNGYYLLLSVSLYVDRADKNRLKVKKSKYQYQLDARGERWVFRYDYLREPSDPHPAAHLQLRGSLNEEHVLGGTPLERIHFPTDRVSIEGVIRLLAEQFGVECNELPEIWRPLLAESEKEFLRIAHRPLSGPDVP